MRIIFIGGGTDAGGWYIGPDGKIHRIPGWNPEAMADLSAALTVLKVGSRIKAKGVADRAIKSVLALAQKELGEYAGKEGGAIVVLG
ncbi:MAG: hypothetical protein IT162_09650 [Bryobacterales bacterium]|nr:hypothetical protein [Bryobacterales bacterium]